MLENIAKSYEYINGKCYVDGIMQTTNDPCGTVGAWIIGILAVIFIPLIIFGIALFIWWIFMLVHVIQNEDIKDRTIWLVALLASLPLGLIWLSTPIYYFAIKRPYDKLKNLSNNAKPKKT